MAAVALRPDADRAAIIGEVNTLIAAQAAAGNVSAAAALRVVRGRVNAAGAVVSGEGFTSANVSPGVFTVTYTVAFAVAPSIVATLTSAIGMVNTASATTLAGVNTFNSSGVAADNGFSFIAVGAA